MPEGRGEGSLNTRTPEYLNTALFAPGDRVLVAVSGGADSLALLHMLAVARTALEIEVVAVHVHHGMRGAAADADLAFLQELCSNLRVELAVSHARVPELAAERRISVEEAGRAARYELFAQIAVRRSCNKIATAHHADDQAETVLLSLIRGGGPDGLAGIPERRRIGTPASPEMVRPLLHRTRAELEAYCREHDLEPRHDSTNDDPCYRRNRIRAEVLPLLAEMEPRVRQHLLRVSALAAEDRDALDELARELLARASRVDENGNRSLLLQPLLEAPRALRRRASKLFVRSVLGYVAEAPIEAVLGLVERGEGPAVCLPGVQVRIRAYSDRLVAERFSAPTETLSDVIPFDGGRGARIPWRPGSRLRSKIQAPPADPRTSPEEAFLDVAALRPPLLLRTPQRGDRFQPLGAPGTRLVSDLLRDRRIPREARAHAVVVADSEGIVWVEGGGIAERARLRAESRECLYLEILTVNDGTV